MFPLAAIGAGIGQFAQDYRQQQESALRQMAAQMQLDALRRSMRDEELLGSVLGSGRVPGFGQMQPTQGLPQPGRQASTGVFQPQIPQNTGPGVGVPPTSLPIPPAPPGGIPEVGSLAWTELARDYHNAKQGGFAGTIQDFFAQRTNAAPNPQPQPPPLGGAPSLKPPQGPRTLTPEQQDQMEDQPWPSDLTPQQIDRLYGAAGAASSREGVPMEIPPPAEPTPAPAAAAPAAPAARPPESTTAGDAQQQAATSGTIHTPAEYNQYLSMFNTANPSDIAQHIKAVRPDADNASVWRATRRSRRSCPAAR